MNAGTYEMDKGIGLAVRSHFYSLRTAGVSVMTIPTPLRRVKFAFATFAEPLDNNEPVSVVAEVNSANLSEVFVRTYPPVIKNVSLHVVGYP